MFAWIACVPVAGQTELPVPQSGTPGAGPSKTPAIALIDAADAPQWEKLAQSAGWRMITVPGSPAGIDQRVQALAAAVQDAVEKSGVDSGRVYLAGRGEASAAVFYTISRLPDLWAAGVAVGGSPESAIDTDRFFAANFTNVPVFWVSSGPNDEALASKLKGAGLNLEWRQAASVNNGAVIEWLSGHHRDEFPSEIDCETNSPTFSRCYWIQMTNFDVGERNDVLPSSRIKGGSGAALELGGFGWKPDDPGPGLAVVLPEKYSGPLKAGDRIVALDGRPIDNARQYVEMMSKITEDQPAVAMVQRGKERLRLETRIVLPRRDPAVTARVQGKYLAEDNEIQIISRTVREIRVTIPPQWAMGSKLSWNGLALERIDGPGCLLLSVDKELLHAAKCP